MKLMRRKKTVSENPSYQAKMMDWEIETTKQSVISLLWRALARKKGQREGGRKRGSVAKGDSPMGFVFHLSLWTQIFSGQCEIQAQALAHSVRMGFDHGTTWLGPNKLTI